MADRPASRRPEVEVETEGIRLPRAWFRKQEFVRWNDVLSITQRSGAGTLTYRRAGGSLGARPLAPVGAVGIEEIKRLWQRSLRLELEHSGAIEGCFAHADNTPIALTLAVCCLGGVVILRSVIAMARTMAELWPAVEDLPGGEAQTWMLLTLALYSSCGMAVAGVVTFAARRALVTRRFGRRFHGWRLDRYGLLRRSPDGESSLLVPTVDDSCDQAAAFFAGEEIPVRYLSGGDLVHDLLLGFAHSRGASVAWRDGARAQALRIVLVWPALVWGGWWLAGRSMGLDAAPPVAEFVLTVLAASGIAGALWLADVRGRNIFAARVEGAKALIEELGW